MPTSKELAEHVNVMYSGLGAGATAVGDDQVVVMLPKDIEDITSMVIALDEEFGATCDIEQAEEGVCMRIWHSGKPLPPAPPARPSKAVWTAGAIAVAMLLLLLLWEFS